VLSIERPPGNDRPLSSPFELDVGRVFAVTFSCWTAQLLPFTVVGIVVHAPALIGYALMAAAEAKPQSVTIFSLFANILNLVVSGSVTYGVFQHLRGQAVGAGELLRKGFSKLGAVWAVGIVTGLGITLGLCALIVPGLILLTRWWLAVHVAVIESPGMAESLSRSTELTEGNRWRVFAVVISFTGVAIVVGAVAGAVTALATSALAPAGAVPALRTLVLKVVLLPVELLAAVAPAVAYHDLRVGKEGVDVDDLLAAFD
jgi:hypothetical protein